MKRNGTGELGRDAWEYLPQKFTVLYAELVRKGLSQLGSSLNGMGERRGGEVSGPLRSDEALHDKAKIDQVLRQLAREAETAQKEPRHKCTPCGRFVPKQGRFCLWCGQPFAGTVDATPQQFPAYGVGTGTRNPLR